MKHGLILLILVSCKSEGRMLNVINNKKYIVLVKRWDDEWNVIRETMHGITEEDAIEVCNYWIKYEKTETKNLKIIEV